MILLMEKLSLMKAILEQKGFEGTEGEGYLAK